MEPEEKNQSDMIGEIKDVRLKYELLQEHYNTEIARLKSELDAVTKSSEIFKIAFESGPDAINFNRLEDGLYVSVNEGFTKIMGYPPEEVIGRTSIELNIWVNTDDRAVLVRQLKEKGRVRSYEANLLTKNGTVINALMWASLVNIEGVQHIVNIVRDITHRKKAEEALLKEQFLINALMNNLSDHVYFKDTESRFIRNNRAHALSFGINDPAQIAGKSDFDFFAEQAAMKAFEDEQTIIRTGQSIQKEEKLTRKDKSDAWFSVIKMPLYDMNEKIIGTFGISRDITERKRTEFENEAIFEITKGITVTNNLDELLKLIHHTLGKVVYAENCFIALYNQKSGLFSFPYFVDKIDSTPLPTAMRKSCSAYVFRTVKPLLLTQKIFDQLFEQGEVELVGSNSPSWIGIPLQTPSKVIGVLVLQHYEKEDVYSESDMRFLSSIGSQIALAIERKQAEEEIRLKNELLQAINAEKDKFFSIIAHDLRGPLSAFVAATQIITEEIQAMSVEEIREITNSMKTSATNIYSLLENLLEWSRLRRGGMDFIPLKFNLKKKFSECINVLSESVHKKRISVEVNIPDELEISADNHMFESVIRNLVSNAVKFTPAGGKVTVSALKINERLTEISVTDSGIGMSPDLKNKLFHISEKTSRLGTEGEPSTGLGLLLCKEFVEKHGGTILAESEEGKGSTFRFTL